MAKLTKADLMDLEAEKGVAMTTDQLNSYDKILIQFSGGKDSVACFLHLMDLGVDLTKVELWHQEIDGREGSNLMDWPVTSDYCRKFAHHFNIPILYQWKVGGFERELIRDNDRTQPTKFQLLDGSIRQAGGSRGKESTRRKFPQQSGDLSVRWCSSYLKIDVAKTAINNDPRFRETINGRPARTLVITGERAQESAGRAKYKQIEPHKADHRDHPSKKIARLVDHFRPVLYWDEAEVWGIIEKYRVLVHPVYFLGISRVSCATCIFSSANQWATLAVINPDQVDQVIKYEDEFQLTINRKKSIRELIETGMPHQADSETIAACLSEDYCMPIQIEDQGWKLPAGAFGESCGPT